MTLTKRLCLSASAILLFGSAAMAWAHPDDAAKVDAPQTDNRFALIIKDQSRCFESNRSAQSSHGAIS